MGNANVLEAFSSKCFQDREQIKLYFGNCRSLAGQGTLNRNNFCALVIFLKGKVSPVGQQLLVLL